MAAVSWAAADSSVTCARRWLRGWLEAIGASIDLGVAELLLSELFTNAVQHSRARAAGNETATDPCARIRMTTRWDRGSLRVEVSDPGGDTVPAPAAPSPDTEHGRGLLIVQALSDDWGTRDRCDGGRTVWFRLGPSR
ncbi:ATP-binding protein [Actinomadura miaoliensis]|uniref:Histidine kinase/HSP90-like ATPase domain-containing protein n=1 Tax=Actinomadura miaoliensis TaxID=430685 RepID=A0ABP7W7I4_9ACTN